MSAALPLFGSWLALELGYLVFFAVSGLVPLRLYPTGLGERWPILGEPTRGLTRLIGTSPVGGAAPSGDWRAVALFATTLLFLAIAAALGWRAARRIERPRRAHALLVLGGAIGFGLTLTFSPVLLSEDLFLYTFYGRISVIHGANPFVYPPNAFPSDPFLKYVFWRDQTALYGPVWLLVSAAVTFVAERVGGDITAYVVLFRLIGIGLHVLAGALVWLVVGAIAPAHRLSALAVYAWNPLVIVEVVGNAHTEGLIAVFLLLAILSLAHGRTALAGAMLSLVIAVKLVFLVLVPLLLWQWWRVTQTEGRHALVRCVVGASLPLVVAYALFGSLPPLGSIAQTTNATYFYNSLHQVAIHLIGGVPPQVSPDPGTLPVLEGALKIAGLVAFGSCFLMLASHIRERQPTARNVANAATWLLLAYVVLACIWFWPWYLVPLLALAVVQPDATLLRTTWLLTAGGLLVYFFLPQYPPEPFLHVFGYRGVLVFGPGIAYLIVAKRLGWRPKIAAPRGAPVGEVAAPRRLRTPR